MCADCDLPLVESLPPESLRELQFRSAGPFHALLAGIRRRSEPYAPVAWPLISWLVVFSAYWLFEVVMAILSLKQAPWQRYILPSAALQSIFLIALPGSAAVGVFFRRPWARTVCLVALASGALYCALMISALVSIITVQSFAEGIPLAFRFRFAWLSAAIVGHCVAFLQVSRRGL